MSARETRATRAAPTDVGVFNGRRGEAGGYRHGMERGDTTDVPSMRANRGERTDTSSLGDHVPRNGVL